MERVDVFVTVNGGRETAQAIENSAARIGMESAATRPPDEFPVSFVDFPFSKDGATYRDHLSVVEEEQPAVAVAPDINEGRDAETVYQQADELAEYAETVVVVPKGVHPTEVPDRFRVGLPMANWDVRTDDQDETDPEEWVDTTGQPQFHQWTDYRDVEAVHILGGSPTTQIQASKYGVPVRSVDGSAVVKGAEFGDVWTPDPAGWTPTEQGRFGFYELLEFSLNNVARGWADRYGYSVERIHPTAWEPEPAGPGKVYDPSRAQQSGRGPPVIDQDDLTALAPGERDEFEVVDWADRMNDAEARFEKNATPAIADGGQPVKLENEYPAAIAGLDKRGITPKIIEYHSPGITIRVSEGNQSAGFNKFTVSLESELSDDKEKITYDEQGGGVYQTREDAIQEVVETVESMANNRPDALAAFDVDEGGTAEYIGEWTLADQNGDLYESPTGQITARRRRDGEVDLESESGEWEHVEESYRDWLLTHDPADAADILDIEIQDDTEMSNDDTYDPTEEWADDRDQQTSLVDDSKRASSDTDSRIDQGGSDDFADDRTYDPTDDVDSGEQASLAPETVDDGGQMDLTGGQATTNVEWKDRDKEDKSRSAALDLMAENGSFHPKLIKGGFDLNSITPAEAIHEMGPDVSHVLKVENNLDDLTEYPGVGDKVASKIRETIPKLKSRNVTRHGLPVESESEKSDRDSTPTGSDDETDEWADAVAYLRENYGEDYQDRIELGSDLGSFANENDLPGRKHLGDEGVLQPLVRFQDVPPEDAISQIEGRTGEAMADHVQETIIKFAQAGAARNDDGNQDDQDDQDADYGSTTYQNFPTTAGEYERTKLAPNEVVYISGASGKDMERYRAELRKSQGGWHITRKIHTDETEAHQKIAAGLDSAEEMREELADRIPLDDDQDTDKTDDQPARTEEIRFGTLDAANEWRDSNEEHVHGTDNRASKTVVIDADAPESVLDDAGTQAQIAQPQDKTYGQVKLTESERDRLEDRDGWTWGQKGFHAMSTKAVLLEEGGTPWLDHYDPKLNPKEHISAIERSTDLAVEQGMSGPGETGMVDDTEKSDAEIAQDLDRAKGEQCRSARDACEEGQDEACRSLLEDCNWTEEEIDELMESARSMGEEPAEIYDPSTDEDTGQSFEEWAAQNAPGQPDEPSDEELRELAPTETPTEMQPPAYRALKKSWSGYKLARQDAREAQQEAEKYASIINGVRAVHDQEPLDFDEIEQWEGGEVMPNPTTEEFPAPDGGQETLQEAAEHGHAASTVQATLDKAADPYDPTEEF